MTITEVLEFADRLIFAHKGKHLDDIQETVIKGVWQGKTYENIAEECNRSESRVRDVGYQLWKIFSESLGEDINKSNWGGVRRQESGDRRNREFIENRRKNYTLIFQPKVNQNPNFFSNSRAKTLYLFPTSKKLSSLYINFLIFIQQIIITFTE